MALTATNRADLRKQLCEMLKNSIPSSGLSSDDPRFAGMTGGLTTTRLRADWARGVITTSCNSFAGWVAQQIGVKPGSVLTRGMLDLSGVEREVPGSWVWANTGEAIEANLHPEPGDFYCSSLPGQEFAHVGIVVEFNETTQEWKWVAGGQGGPKSNFDFIKWGPWQTPDRRFPRAKVVGWVDIGWYMFPKGP